MLLRQEAGSDALAIRSLIVAAFQDAPHASGTEADIVDALRMDSALTLSLVATEADEIVGHVAFSPVTIDGKELAWYGLGPVAVRHDVRRQGIGADLIKAGLDGLREMDAGGCVVLGEPAYYGRFGFTAEPLLFLAGVPTAYFQSLHLGGSHPVGEVQYHPAFSEA